MITITVTQDNKTLTISHPFDIVLTPDDERWYSWRHVFATILFWLSWDKDAIKLLMPDCEECDVVEELNREHNAEMSAQCERCEYKTEGVNEGVKNCDNCGNQNPGVGGECAMVCRNHNRWIPMDR